MKKNLIVAGILGTMLTGTIAYAFVTGIEPPASYINNLRNCIKSTVTQQGPSIIEYTIKGRLPDDRCEVYISDYTNFADSDVYEGFRVFGTIAKDIAKDDSPLPSQQEMIEQAKKAKVVHVCKFSRADRQALYNAYKRHDGKNPAKAENGNTTVSLTLDAMSSYDKLMMNMINDKSRCY